MNQLRAMLVVVCILITTWSCMLHVVLSLKTTLDINTDMSALLTFKSQLIILPPSNYNYSILKTNWSGDSDVCSWIGVSCGGRHRRVTSLDLSSMGFGGVLPPHLGNLSFLTDISLYNNTFHGSIPSELFLLRRLKSANFAGNQFSGHIPSNIFSAPSLLKVSIQDNQFTGPIPSNLFLAPSLLFVDLGSNFLSGSIPITNISNTTSSLIFLGIDFNNLTGELPGELFYHLPHLEAFLATYNMLSGPIPSSLGRCRLLQALSLSYNDFEGSIPPETGNLTVLTDLFLNHNMLTGAIPSEVAGLINSETLNLDNNALTGEIPSSITNLTKLIQLTIENNNLTGQITQQIWNHLQSLQILSFSNNHLSGSLPPTIFNSSSLAELDVNENQLSGSLPPSVGFNLPNLQWLDLSVNLLSGTIPVSLFNSSKLINLEMADNRFSGPIPNELGSLRQLRHIILALNNLTLTSSHSFFASIANCRSLTILELTGNPLNTILPSSIGNLSTTFQYLYLGGCQLEGTIPPQVGNLINLVMIFLGSNRLSGVIPTTVGRLENIQSFDLGDNRLESPIPHDICKLSRIFNIDLGRNAFNGSIPACLGSLSSLRKLSMTKNKLSMEVPSSLWNLRDISWLDLSSNSLSGPMSQEIGSLKVATFLSFADNQFTGNIPPTIGDLINIQNLSLANNKLEGSIPNSFGNLISLQNLDLSRNNLSGVIPKTLEKLSNLKYFNVSVNRLEGQIPDGGPFANFSAQSFILNGDLCGSAHFAVPSCKIVAPRKNNKAPMTLIRKYVIPIISAVSIVVFGLLVLVLILVRRRKMNNVADNVTEMVPTAICRRVSYYELVQATNQFHGSNLLGAGAFGSVFKGTLSDGIDIAVKVFNQNMGEAFESFYNECEVLRSIRHMNLVKVITSCSSPDFKCLIMEYMPNGSLEKWLYDTYNLNILQRLSIVIDVAKALEYLHHGHVVPVVHCDLKPSNVLLDEDMVAHVTDFGISKLLTREDSITQTLTLATFGYTAPEYGLEGIVSTRGDVYSYGIMLMETFVGKRPTDELFAAGMSLPQWVKKSLPHNVHEVAAFGLLNIEDQHFEKKRACISEIMELALGCCSEKREDRPNITDISTKLKKMHARLLHDPRFIP